MTATVNKPTITIIHNGEELPVPVRGNSALATLVRAGVATEEWSMPSATTAEVYTVRRCLRTGRILHSTCKCWAFNPRRDVEDCHHTSAVAEAAKLREIVASYSGPEWTLGALRAEDQRLRELLDEEDSRLIRAQYTALGTVIARATAGERRAA